MGTPLKQNRSLKENANSRHDKKQHLDIKWQRTKYKVKTITTIFKVSFCRGDFSSFSYLWLPTTCILPPLQGNHELSWVVKRCGEGNGNHDVYADEIDPKLIQIGRHSVSGIVCNQCILHLPSLLGFLTPQVYGGKKLNMYYACTNIILFNNV